MSERQNHHAASQAPNRRSFVTQAAATASLLAGATVCHSSAAQDASARTTAPVKYCLNTSTINGGQIPIREQFQIAARAGYTGIEIWVRDADRFVAEGGKLSDLRQELADLGLSVESAIAFGKWIASEDAQRREGIEQCKRDMEVVRQLGGRRMAAPPVGVTDQADLDLDMAARCYRELLEVGRARDVTPQVELWGFSRSLSRLEEVLYVAAAAQHPDACVLLDVYHMYKGGADFSSVGLIPTAKLHCLHMNDYPATPGRNEIGDADRVYPGDGVAPLDHILGTLLTNGFTGVLSLELFNRRYWERPADEVAKLGLEKMQAAVASAQQSIS